MKLYQNQFLTQTPDNNIGIRSWPERASFLALSATISRNSLKEDFGSIFMQGDKQKKVSGVFHKELTPKLWKKLSPIEKESLLIQIHERDHFRLFTTTPIGLLWWRTLWVLSVGVVFFCQQFEMAGLEKFPKRTKLTAWYRKYGFDILKNAAEKNKIQHPQKHLLSSSQFVHGLLDKMEDVCQELDTLTEFVRILFLPPKRDRVISVGEFLSIANKSYKYISERSDLPQMKWTSSSPLDYPLFGKYNWHLNILELCEASALFREYSALQNMKASSKEITDWKNRRLSKSHYVRPFKLLNSIQPSELVHDLIGLSFCNFFNLIGRNEGEIIVESLPHVSIERAIRNYNKSNLPFSSINEFRNEIFGIYQFSSVKQSLSIGTLNKYFGKNAFPKIREFEKELQRESESQFRKGMTQRLMAYGNGELFQSDLVPYIEFYKDFVSLNNGYTMKKTSKYTNRVQEIVFHNACLALVFNDSKRTFHPDVFIKPYINRCVGPIIDENLKTQFKNMLEEQLNWKSILKSNIGQVGLNSLTFI